MTSTHADAASTGTVPNVSFTIPTTVPLAIKSDGTVISTDSLSWRIENTGSTPITLDSVTASGMSDGTIINFATSSTPVYGTNSSYDNWTYMATSLGSYLDTHGNDSEHPAIIEASSAIRCGWSAYAISSDDLHSVSSSPLKIADVKFTVKPVYQQTFAVYSDTDKSLDFYKRVSTSLPAEGDTFNGKTATSVYTGFENGGYHFDQVSTTTTPWFEHHSDIERIHVHDSGIKIYDIKAFFSQLENLTDADEVSKLDLSECRDMHDLFYACVSLESIDLSGLDVSSIFYMSCMFHDDCNLKKIDCTGWDTSSVKSMSMMFAGTTELTDISGIESFDTRNVATIRQMFYCTFKLSDLNLSKWNTSNVTDFDGVFCRSSLSNVDFVSNWNVSSASTFEGMLSKMPNLEHIDISRWNIKNDANVTGFSNEDSLLRYISLPASLMTSNRSGLLPIPSSSSIDGATGKWYAKSDSSSYDRADIPVGKADTYYAVPAFAVYSESDKSLDFYNSDNVPKAGTDYNGKIATSVYMGVEDIERNVSPSWSDIVSNVETATVADTIRPRSICRWFYSATSLKKLDIDKMITSKVKDAKEFLYFATIDSLDLSDRDFSSCTNFAGMLSNMPNLVSVNVRNMDVSNGTIFYDMFYRDPKLTTLDCAGWDTSKGNDFWGFACACQSLMKVDISSFTISKTARTDHMFGYGTEGMLQELKIGEKCWLNKTVDSVNKDKVGALPASAFTGSTGRWFSTTDGKTYEYKEENCTYPYGIATTLKPQMKASTPSNLTVSGRYVVSQTLTCNATAEYDLSFQWQRGRDDWWADISGAVESTLKLTSTQSLYKIRCVVAPATNEYDGKFFAYSADEANGEEATVSDQYWYGAQISSPSSSRVGETIHIEQTGSLPDDATYGASTPVVTWMRDGGGTVIDGRGKTITVSKSTSSTMSRWSSFIGHTNVYPGQTYKMRYGSFVKSSGEEDCDIVLCEWTKAPGSSMVSKLAKVPYSATGWEIEFSIPDNLDANSYYTIVVAPGWGTNPDYYKATLNDYSIVCEGNGFVPVTKIKSYDYVPTEDAICHKLIACVSWNNEYYTIVHRVSNPIAIE